MCRLEGAAAQRAWGGSCGVEVSGSFRTAERVGFSV